MERTLNREEVFESFIYAAALDLTGRPLKSTFANYDFCVDDLRSIVVMSGRVFGFDSEEYKYIDMHLKSMEGEAFIGPIQTTQSI